MDSVDMHAREWFPGMRTLFPSIETVEDHLAVVVGPPFVQLDFERINGATALYAFDIFVLEIIG